MRSILAGIPNQTNSTTVNSGKCLFEVEETSSAGLTFNKKGIQPDPTKVEPLHFAGTRKSKEDLRSLLGMAGFSERLIPSSAKTTTLLREFLKEDTWD